MWRLQNTRPAERLAFVVPEPNYMNALQNAFHVTPRRKRFLVFLACAMVVATSHVPIVQAAEVLPEKSTPPALILGASAIETAKNAAALIRYHMGFLPGPRLQPEARVAEIGEATSTVMQVAPKVAPKPTGKKLVEAAKELDEEDASPAVRTLIVPTTAYTSDPAETDSTPFITADGSHVRDGIVAANFLPMGTKIRIPDYYGNKVFEVHDRMNARYWQRVDIWMGSKAAAMQWGIRNVKIEILPNK